MEKVIIIMKDRLEKYIRKKKRDAAIKIIKDNMPTILGALAVLMMFIILKVVAKRAKKKVKTWIVDTIKENINNTKTASECADDGEYMGEK